MLLSNNRHIKKAWSPIVVVPRSEALALPNILKRQREAHAEYKIYSRAILIIEVRVCVYVVYTQ